MNVIPAQAGIHVQSLFLFQDPVLTQFLNVGGWSPWGCAPGRENGLCPSNQLQQEIKMKRYKVYPEITSYYYSTLSITAWIPIFQNNHYFRLIITSLQFCRKNKGLFLLGYVIMPTHLHLITSNEVNTTLPEIMRDFKNFTSKNTKTTWEGRAVCFFKGVWKSSPKFTQATVQSLARWLSSNCPDFWKMVSAEDGLYAS